MASNANNKLTQRKELLYKIVSDAIRSKLLESVVTLDLLELIGFEGSLTAEEIIEELELSPSHGRKWLHLLSLENFLLERKLEKTNAYSYSLGPMLKKLFISSEDWWFNKAFVYSWRTVCFENIVSMLQGGELSFDVNWPPKTLEDTASLEEWMTRSALPVINFLNINIPFQNVKKILDVGGGEGTIACALAQKNPSVNFTIYNLPQAITLARNKINEENLSDRIDTVEGNFLTDEAFPTGYDIILFSRVLCDWPEEVCRKLIKMAYDALNENGHIIICEPFRELNEGLILIWEYRYMFWDNFGKAVFKPSELYLSILKETGFVACQLSDVDTADINRVLKAMKGRPLAF